MGEPRRSNVCPPCADGLHAECMGGETPCACNNPSHDLAKKIEAAQTLPAAETAESEPILHHESGARLEGIPPSKPIPAPTETPAGPVQQTCEVRVGPENDSVHESCGRALPCHEHFFVARAIERLRAENAALAEKLVLLEEGKARGHKINEKQKAQLSEKDRDAATLREKLADANRKQQQTESTLKMYAGAWAREIGPPYHLKTHEIDGLVLTTRERVAALREAEKNLAAVTQERDAMRVELGTARIELTGLKSAEETLTKIRDYTLYMFKSADLEANHLRNSFAGHIWKILKGEVP